ncbi:MAG: CaiB/BaiF CoA transferase family protein, partial [Rhizomicrobium sp.]
MSDATAEPPLADLRVVDFTHFIAGPFCTMILADFGADVIKIESPEGGDGFRQYPPHRDGEGAPFLWTNRNKASVALDLKTEAGRDVALALAETADVVVENFSTGVMQRLGLDYETVKSRNPRVIYCSISAYGRSGPHADRVGFDPIAQAESGFISMNGRPDGEGMRAGPSIMDMATAMLSCN